MRKTVARFLQQKNSFIVVKVLTEQQRKACSWSDETVLSHFGCQAYCQLEAGLIELSFIKIIYQDKPVHIKSW